jgi:uncharacterized protein (TIGR02757 family)
MKDKKIKNESLRDFLNQKVEQYNRPEFLSSDPIQIPHMFSDRRDIEISGFLTATIAWGNRKSIINNATQLMDLLDRSPYQFVAQHQGSDLRGIRNFVHRTFNGTDLLYFLRALQHIYREYGGMEPLFHSHARRDSLQHAISEFRSLFFTLEHQKRTEKHVSDPGKGSAAKRINMFLRWMVRDAKSGVDFGIWKSLNPAQLSCPLDVHSGNVARKLGLLTRKQNDARAVAELDENLRILDPEDPVKYDFALFGLGVFEKF